MSEDTCKELVTNNLEMYLCTNYGRLNVLRLLMVESSNCGLTSNEYRLYLNIFPSYLNSNRHFGYIVVHH